ncbi:MAG: carotenoid oxygenase family protein [Pseudomonadota bacterium]
MSTAQPQLNRRAFCQSAVAGGFAYAFGCSPRAGAVDRVPDAQQAFASSFRDVPDTYGPTRVRFNAPLPAGLRGTLYRNGPARMQRGDTRYNHWFDGDGMVHAFALDGDHLTHRARMVDTARSAIEAQAGRFLWSGFGTGFDDGRTVAHPDDVNVANINVLPVGDDILALWEAGSPYRLHAETLETLERHVFSTDTDGLPFSAHPRVDPTGRIWNFGYLSGSGKLVLYDLNADGSMHRVTLIDAPNADMVHDFAITEEHLVFVLQPIRFDRQGDPASPFLDRLRWDSDGAVHVLLVDKDTLSVSHRFELPAFFAFHLGNAWRDGGSLRVEVATAPDFHSLMADIEAATRGQRLPATVGRAQAAEIRLNLLTGTAEIDTLPTSGIDFPRFDQRFTGRRTNALVMMGRAASLPPAAFGFNTVTVFDRARGTEALYDYGSNTLAEEHLFVPAPHGTAGVGWVIGTHYNWKTRRTGISVFNAAHVEDGPVAEATLTYGLPMGLHGQFVSR